MVSAEKLVSLGRCSQVLLKLQKVPFATDFFILPLQGYDVVLGTQWLRMLGPIQWDFEKLLMKILKDGKEIVLHGVTSSRIKVTPDQSLTRISKSQ